MPSMSSIPLTPSSLEERSKMIEDGVLITDIWDKLAEGLREEFLSRSVASATLEATYADLDPDGIRWRPLRPVIIEERAYRYLESTAARLLHLAVEACRRRAATLGELHQALRFDHDLPLMDPNRPLIASELTRYARPDILIEQGRPRLLEFNSGTRLGGGQVTPRLAEDFAQLCPRVGLHPPPSVVTARSAALVRTLGGDVGRGDPRRLLIPAYWAIDGAGRRRRHEKVKNLMVADARRVGFEVVLAELADLRLDAAGRLLAAGVPIDLVLIQGSYARVVDDDGGFAALRGADRARTVKLFPRTESALISSKAVLAWLHEDCDAGLLAPADHDLVRNCVPRTVCLGLIEDSAAPEDPAHVDQRDRLVVKPVLGKKGSRVLFGSQTAAQDWVSATIDAARQSPVVLQHRVQSDRITMPFLDQESGRRVTAQVPLVLSPFMIDGMAASVGVRHMCPDTPAGDVVISANRGASSNTVVLAAHPGRGPR